MDALRFVGGQHRAVISFTVLAVLLALPAAAVEGPFDPDPNSTIVHSQSIESETTFDLYENEYDQMLMPSYMGFFEDKGRYYTQLGNTGGQDVFQFGHYRPLGPGYFAFRVFKGSDEFEVTSSGETQDFDIDVAPNFFPIPNIDAFSDSDEFEFEEGGIYAGYAWQLSDNNSLGFGLDYYVNNIDEESTDIDIDDPRPGQGPGPSDDTTTTTFSGFEEEQEWITLIAEYMHRGDMSWRVKGFVQDVDHTIENTSLTDTQTVIDSLEGGSSCTGGTCRFETERIRQQFGVGGDHNNDTEGVPGGSFLNRVGHDGQVFGVEGDLRFEGNPKLHHQVNVGISFGDFDPQNDAILRDETITTFIDDVAATTTTTISADNQFITDDDISSDSQFVTWKTRFHRGDTHAGVGIYWFNFKSETEITVAQDSEFTALDGSTVTFSSVTDGSFIATVEHEEMTFSIPFALEQDLSDRVQVRLGAQYIWTNLNDEFSDVFTLGDVTTDPDGAGGGAPVVTVQRQIETNTEEFDDSFDEAVYYAGLRAKFERVDLELLFSETDGGGSNREAVDLDQVYIGATFKLGDRK